MLRIQIQVFRKSAGKQDRLAANPLPEMTRVGQVTPDLVFRKRKNIDWDRGVKEGGKKARDEAVNNALRGLIDLAAATTGIEQRPVGHARKTRR